MPAMAATAVMVETLAMPRVARQLAVALQAER